MLAADADAPTGNHHVFAMKKYVLTKVISQMMISRTRPMDHDLPPWILGLPHRGPARDYRDPRTGGIPNCGEYIIVPSVRKRVLAFLFFLQPASRLDVQKIFPPKIKITH